MKYCSISIQSTGPDYRLHQVLSLSLVLDDLCVQEPLSELPQFSCYLSHSSYHNMEPSLINDSQILATLTKIGAIQDNDFFKSNGSFRDNEGVLYLRPANLGLSIYSFLMSHQHPQDKLGRVLLNLAGNQVNSVDQLFLQALIPNWSQYFVFGNSIDPSILFLDPIQDQELPSLVNCLTRTNLSLSAPINPIERCLATIQLLRFFYHLK